MGTTVRSIAIAGAAALLVLTVGPTRARADVAIAFDADYATPLKLDGVTSGYGFGVRLGSPLHIPFLVLTPEVGFTYHAFGGDASATVYRGIGGLRLGVGEIIRPGVYGHAGYGARKVDVAGRSDTSSSFTYDVGAFLDLTVIPLLDLGIHAGYDQWTGGGQASFQFAVVGAHAALVF
jgi:hypothetical protein